MSAAQQARELAAQLTLDIQQSSTRMETIRLTARALEAERLAERLEEMEREAGV